MATRMSVPTTAFAMPPPASPTGAGRLVKKSKLSAGAPFAKTYASISRRTSAASAAASPERLTIAMFISFRRR